MEDDHHLGGHEMTSGYVELRWNWMGDAIHGGNGEVRGELRGSNRCELHGFQSDVTDESFEQIQTNNSNSPWLLIERRSGNRYAEIGRQHIVPPSLGIWGVG